MAFLLTFTVMMYGMNVGRSVIQEKTSRIFEVMLSTVEPKDMLAGKLIGIGAVGLSQLAIWAAAAGIFSTTALAASVMTGELTIHISVPQIILFAVYFLLGYALYSTLFAGLAATCESEQELQQYAPLAAVPVWLSFSMITFIMSNPNSFWSVAVSLFPPCAPIAMFPAHRLAVPADMADRPVSHPPTRVGSLRRLVLIAHLSHRYPHVRQTSHPARNLPLAEIQLELAIQPDALRALRATCTMSS